MEPPGPVTPGSEALSPSLHLRSPRSRPSECCTTSTSLLDSGVKPSELSEIVTHLAFYTGWSTALSGCSDSEGDLRRAWDRRGSTSGGFASAALPLDETAEAQRASTVEKQNFGSVAPGVVQYTTNLLFRDLSRLRPALAASRSEPGHCQRARCFEPRCTDHVSLEPSDGSRAATGRKRLRNAIRISQRSMQDGLMSSRHSK